MNLIIFQVERAGGQGGAGEGVDDRRRGRGPGARTGPVPADLRLPRRVQDAGSPVRLRGRSPASHQRAQDAGGDAQPAAAFGGRQFGPGAQLDRLVGHRGRRCGAPGQGGAHRRRQGRSPARRRHREQHGHLPAQGPVQSPRMFYYYYYYYYYYY